MNFRRGVVNIFGLSTLPDNLAVNKYYQAIQPNKRKARFFRNQEKLKEIHIEQDLTKALQGVEAVILAVPHEAYLNLDPDEIVDIIGQPVAIIDCFGILSDEKIKRYFQLGCEVKGLGRGHIQRIKEETRKV